VSIGTLNATTLLNSSVHRRKTFHRLVGRGTGSGDGRVLRAGEHQQRIAIWRGILNGSRTDGSARTRPIIDTNPLANSARYRFCIDARR